VLIHHLGHNCCSETGGSAVATAVQFAYDITSWGMLWLPCSKHCVQSTLPPEHVAGMVMLSFYCVPMPIRLSLAAVFKMRAATIAPPKPLSMLTTETPGELDTSADSMGVAPFKAAP